MFSYNMEKRGSASLYEYLYRCIRHDIARGIIPPNQKLPSKRTAAKHLGVSLITIEAAYQQLIAEGYVKTRERSGYYVCELAPAAQGSTGRKHPDAGKRTVQKQKPKQPSIATSLFPYSAWAKTMRLTLAEETSETLAQAASTAGSPQLREAIAAYLHDYRGMSVQADQIVVGAGSQTLYQLIIQLLGRDRIYAVEDPGYPLLTRMYQLNNVPLAHVPMDDEGIQIDQLQASEATVAHIMPSHQFPTGVITSASRRRELLNWARKDAEPTQVEPTRVEQTRAEPTPTRVEQTGSLPTGADRSGSTSAGATQSESIPAGMKRPEANRTAQRTPEQPAASTTGKLTPERLAPEQHAPERCSSPSERYIIEDDYDSEFRMMGKPISSLFSIDAANRVLYLNSFAKSLGEAFRIAYLVLPPQLAEKFHSELGFYANTVSPIDQLTLARFIANGHYERHVSRLRTQARRTQSIIVEALGESALKDRVSFRGLNSGLHFILSVEGTPDEQQIAAAIAQTGISLSHISEFQHQGRAKSDSPDHAARKRPLSTATRTAPANLATRAEPSGFAPQTNALDFVVRTDAIAPDKAQAFAQQIVEALK